MKELSISIDARLDHFEEHISKTLKAGHSLARALHSAVVMGKWNPSEPWVYTHLDAMMEDAENGLFNELQRLKRIARMVYIARNGGHPETQHIRDAQKKVVMA